MCKKCFFTLVEVQMSALRVQSACSHRIVRLENSISIKKLDGSGDFNASCYRYYACNSAFLKVQIECTISGAVRFKKHRYYELNES